MKNQHFSYLLLILVIFFACATNIEVVPLSKEAKDRNINTGIPYYLPKPYLLITQNFDYIHYNQDTIEKNTDSESNTPTTTTIAEQIQTPLENTFSCRIIYLPDTSEKYGIKISRGTGNFEGDLNIVDGWKFVGFDNLKTDSQTDEILSSLSALLEKLAPTGVPMAKVDKALLDSIAAAMGTEVTKRTLEVPLKAALILYDLSDLSKPVLHWQSTDHE